MEFTPRLLHATSPFQIDAIHGFGLGTGGHSADGCFALAGEFPAGTSRPIDQVGLAAFAGYGMLDYRLVLSVRQYGGQLY